MSDDEMNILPFASRVAVRAAVEGVPVSAIARIIEHPYTTVAAVLANAKNRGEIVALPRSDWPPGGSSENRTRVAPPLSPADMEFAIKSTFKLSNLEAGFMTVLLRHTSVEKEKLHYVIEQQRSFRQLRPDRQEPTDPKMVDVMICKLRKKLKDFSETLQIKTSWGTGYYLEQSVKEEVWKLATASIVHQSQPLAA